MQLDAAPPSVITTATLSLAVVDLLRITVPVLLLYYLTAVLVVLPNDRTFTFRLALLPCTLYTAFETARTLCRPSGDLRLSHLNHGLMVAMIGLTLRVLIWTFRQETCVRDGKNPSQYTLAEILTDAADLTVNLRGIGWVWSKGLFIAKETRPTSSRFRFAVATLQSFLVRTVIVDLIHYYLQSLSPDTFGSVRGGTIYDTSLPSFLRAFRALEITLLAGFVVYISILFAYDCATLLGVCLLGQSPEVWPPLMHAPWEATSLTELWGKRWHQMFRDVFIWSAAKPASCVFGRWAGALSVSLVSGLAHVCGLMGMGRGPDVVRVAGFFLMMGLGTAMEDTVSQLTGRPIRGSLGWVWTQFWFVGWGQLLVEAYFQKGLCGCVLLPDELRPAPYIVSVLSSLFRNV
ncbi:hypothetical protein FISHEDRAFT_75412 [Fistulina hepatica ATCC 64428]|uniref:Wax synthase domain-containing protein n=1 Tax=Fistulina hepatica ATCC 64428 TaxID=1128425 RepID=A0A0D7A8J2_9AGAR|nr:hypothetical protein FISHEDRAFT_75412 [Fistulina hepatica ATCC 64428]